MSNSMKFQGRYPVRFVIPFFYYLSTSISKQSSRKKIITIIINYFNQTLLKKQTFDHHDFIEILLRIKINNTQQLTCSE